LCFESDAEWSNRLEGERLESMGLGVWSKGLGCLSCIRTGERMGRVPRYLGCCVEGQACVFCVLIGSSSSRGRYREDIYSGWGCPKEDCGRVSQALGDDRGKGQTVCLVMFLLSQDTEVWR
jgi:hypothetical protein